MSGGGNARVHRPRAVILGGVTWTLESPASIADFFPGHEVRHGSAFVGRTHRRRAACLGDRNEPDRSADRVSHSWPGHARPRPATPGYKGPVLYSIASAALGDPLGLLGKTSFSFTDFQIDLPSVVTADNGSMFTQAQQVTFLESGVDYLNVHTTAFPDSEIRGQIPSSAPAAVPETGTAVSLGLLLALGSLAVVRGRRAKPAA